MQLAIIHEKRLHDPAVTMFRCPGKSVSLNVLEAHSIELRHKQIVKPVTDEREAGDVAFDDIYWTAAITLCVRRAVADVLRYFLEDIGSAVCCRKVMFADCTHLKQIKRTGGDEKTKEIILDYLMAG